MKIGSKLAIIVFTVVAAVHLARLVLGVSVTVDDWLVPQWTSVLGLVVPGLIAWMLWREST